MVGSDLLRSTFALGLCPFQTSGQRFWSLSPASWRPPHGVEEKHLLLVVLAPVTAKHSGRVFVLVEDFAVDGPDDTVTKTTGDT